MDGRRSAEPRQGAQDFHISLACAPGARAHFSAAVRLTIAPGGYIVALAEAPVVCFFKIKATTVDSAVFFDKTPNRFAPASAPIPSPKKVNPDA